MHRKSGLEDVPVAIPAMLELTLAIGPYPDQTFRISHYGNFETYGDLLNFTEARIENEEDAKRVWQAFCEIHGKAWMDHEEVCAWEWRLGFYKTECEISEVGGGKITEKQIHYCRVTLDPISHRVNDWKLMAETTRHPFYREINSLDSRAIIPPALEVERI